MSHYRKSLSAFFPAYHPSAGHKTFFVEKVWSACGYQTGSMLVALNCDRIKSLDSKLTLSHVMDFYEDISATVFKTCIPKLHTIREGHKVKVGDTIDFFVWSGLPYRTPQIVVTPKIEVKKVWDFDFKLVHGNSRWYINGTCISDSNPRGTWFNAGILEEIAKNDGLDLSEMLEWFQYPKPFSGQIICWADSVKY